MPAITGKFDANAYLAANPDVKNAGMNGADHWGRYGINEGRLGFIVGRAAGGRFDANGYLDLNPDVRNAKMDALAHFRDYGWKEGRTVCITNTGEMPAITGKFDANAYLAANPDVKNAGMNGADHWGRYGINEGRLGFIVGRAAGGRFDANGYLDLNPDVRNAKMDALAHFRDYGWKEGRTVCITNVSAGPNVATIPIEWLKGDQPKLLSMMAACEKRREGLKGDWWEGFAKDDVRTHAQAIGQYRDTMYVAFSQLSGAGQLWVYNKASGEKELRTDILPADHPHPCSIQVVDRYLVVAVESAYPSAKDPRPEFSTVAIYDLSANPMQPAEVARIRQPDCNCGGAGLAFHPKTNRWYVLADQDKSGAGKTRLYRSGDDKVSSFSSMPLKVYDTRFGSGAGNNLITASDGSIWALYYSDTTTHLPTHMSWTMTADAVRLWKVVEPDGTPVSEFKEVMQYTNIGSPQLGDVGVFLNDRPGMRFGATLRSENGQLELLTCQRNMKSTFNVDRTRLEDGKCSVMFVCFGAFEAEIYCSIGGPARHSGHLPVSQSWGVTMDRASIHADINHNAGFTWVDDWKGDTTAPLTLFVVKGETQSAKVEIHSFTTGYAGKVEVKGHSPEGIDKLNPTNW